MFSHNLNKKIIDGGTKMSLSKLTSLLYKTARFVGDINAVRKGTFHKRMKNRVVSKAINKKLF